MLHNESTSSGTPRLEASTAADGTMIEASLVLLEDSVVRAVSGARRAFVAPVASVQGELGVLTLQSSHACGHAVCHNPGNHHAPSHYHAHHS